MLHSLLAWAPSISFHRRRRPFDSAAAPLPCPAEDDSPTPCRPLGQGAWRTACLRVDKVEHLTMHHDLAVAVGATAWWVKPPFVVASLRLRIPAAAAGHCHTREGRWRRRWGLERRRQSGWRFGRGGCRVSVDHITYSRTRGGSLSNRLYN